MLPPARLAHCQLGYTPGSPKTLTLCPSTPETRLKDRIPFYLRALFDRIPRDHTPPPQWKGTFFRWPFDLSKGRLIPEKGRILMQGELEAVDSRWGRFWQADFSALQEEGIYQIETEYGVSFPITIGASIYDRLQRSFLIYLNSQRSGYELPGLRKAEHLDDGILDTDGTQIAAAGGWYDAGDLRKWLFLTQPNLAALAVIARHGHPGLRARAVEEIMWGNRYFHAMITPEGQVWEDLGGGMFKPGLNYEEHWWYENHPGCNCDGQECRYTDNQPGTGDERHIRTSYNPAVQFMFVRTQCQVLPFLDPLDASICQVLASRAWRYGRKQGHDGRTLFVAEELWAGLEAHACGIKEVSLLEIKALASELLSRQDCGNEGLSGYFMEKGQSDGFRCIALSCEPALALLRLVEMRPPGLETLCERAADAVIRYIDRYLLADARSNPFGLGPYGVYIHPPMPEAQLFRDAGRGRGVRTFIHPFSPQQIVHGTGSVVMHQASLVARAALEFGRDDWRQAAERWIHWTLGHNPEALCLHTGVGYQHPVPFSGYLAQVPEAMCVGHIGRPDDSPYQEASNLIEWSSQEIWDIPHGYLAEAVVWLGASAVSR